MKAEPAIINKYERILFITTEETFGVLTRDVFDSVII